MKTLIDRIKHRMFSDVYMDATRRAIESLQDDLVIIVEPKTLYDKGWNDAMKAASRTLNNYKRCGVVK